MNSRIEISFKKKKNTSIFKVKYFKPTDCSSREPMNIITNGKKINE